MTSILLICCGFTAHLAKAGEYYVGVENVPYFPLFDFNNEAPNFTKDLLDEFGRQYNHTFHYVALPIKRFERWLVEEDIDFKYPDNVRWSSDRELYSQFTFSNSTIKLVAGTITLNEFKGGRDNLKVLGTLLGFHPTLWMEDIKAGRVTLYEHSSTMVLLQQLLRGQIDGINLEQSVVNYHLTKLGKQNEVKINKNFTYQVYDYQLSTIKHKKVIEQFNQFLTQNRAFVSQLKQTYQIVDHTPYIRTSTIAEK